MAKKKVKTESVLSRETRLQAEANAIAAAKLAVEQAAAEKLRRQTPPPKAERPKKVKRPRFVREQVEKRPPMKQTALVERSTKAVAKMMTKNVSELPPDELASGVTAKGRIRP